MGDHFMHFLTPDKVEDFGRHAIFVLDVSGSMNEDNKIEFVRRSMVNIVSAMRDQDYVNIITFNSQAQVRQTLHCLLKYPKKYYSIFLHENSWFIELSIRINCNIRLRRYFFNPEKQTNFTLNCSTKSN